MDGDQHGSGYARSVPHPLCGSERGRLEAIERLRAARPAADGALQEILDTVRGVFGVDLCAVNLLLSDIVYVRAWSGALPQSLTAARRDLRERFICPRVVDSGEPLLVEDLLEARDLREHYACTAYGLRFYAGVPLITSEGRVIGTLCLTDSRPREFERDGMLMLKHFARAVTGRIEFLGDLSRERESRQESKRN